MTAHDILRIIIAISVAQCTADVLSRKLIFEKETYQRSVQTVERLKLKRGKAGQSKQLEQKPGASSKGGKSSSNDNSMSAKKKRAESDYKEAVAQVSRQHVMPSIITAIFFYVILYRYFAAEFKGQVIALLPFTPWNIVQRVLTRRGLPATVSPRACGFSFIYMLSSFSIKIAVHKLLAVVPPKECESMTSILDTAKAQEIMKQMGVNIEEVNEARDAVRQVFGMNL